MRPTTGRIAKSFGWIVSVFVCGGGGGGIVDVASGFRNLLTISSISHHQSCHNNNKKSGVAPLSPSLLFRKQQQQQQQTPFLFQSPSTTSSSSSLSASSTSPKQSEGEEQYDDDSESSSWESVAEADEENNDNSDSAVSSDDEVGDVVVSDDPLYQEYLQWMKAVDKTITALEKKRKSLLSELQKAEKLEAMVARAHLLTSNLYLFTPGVTTAQVQDWENLDDSTGEPIQIEVSLDPKYEGSASAEADALFSQARKLKRGTQIVQQLLEETTAAVDAMEEILVDAKAVPTNTGGDDDSTTVDVNILRLVQDRLLRSSRATKFEAPSPQQQDSPTPTKKSASKYNKKKAPAKLGSPASNVRKISSAETGTTILVGRNRRGNEFLSLSCARPNDYWLHARGCPGAHVLVKVDKQNQQPKDEALQLAANVALFYSDLRSERRAEVTVTQAKHITKPRNAPLGAVTLRQELRVVTGVPSDVPETLKEARRQELDQQPQGESGGELYRAADKAKHRKQTRAAEEDRRKKRRQQQKAKSKRKQKK